MSKSNGHAPTPQRDTTDRTIESALVLIGRIIEASDCTLDGDGEILASKLRDAAHFLSRQSERNAVPGGVLLRDPDGGTIESGGFDIFGVTEHQFGAPIRQDLVLWDVTEGEWCIPEARKLVDEYGAAVAVQREVDGPLELYAPHHAPSAESIIREWANREGWTIERPRNS